MLSQFSFNLSIQSELEAEKNKVKILYFFHLFFPEKSIVTLGVQNFPSRNFREVEKSRNLQHSLSRKELKFAKIAKVPGRESLDA